MSGPRWKDLNTRSIVSKLLIALGPDFMPLPQDPYVTAEKLDIVCGEGIEGERVGVARIEDDIYDLRDSSNLIVSHSYY
jgi:hypothetical protein